MNGTAGGDPDEHLYRNLLDGDGEEAVRNLLPRIKRFVCSKYPWLSQDAEDLASSAMVRIFERIKSFNPTKRFSSWCFGVTRFVVLEWLQERGKQPDTCDLDENIKDEESDPEKIVLAELSMDIDRLDVQEALATLTELQQTVFNYCYTTKLKSPQIAELIGRSPNAVRSAKADAHAALQRWRKKKGYK